jgi:phage portal protein BeeE
MGLFNRTTKAAISPMPTKAAAAGGYTPNAQGLGPAMIGQYYTYQEGDARNRAVSVPTINRARDLMASVIGCMPLRMYNEIWNGEELEKVPLAPRSWLRRPDPTVPYQFIMSWTFDDLLFFGRAFWYITSRTADGYPATFTRLPAGSITTTDMVGPVWFAPSQQVFFNGGQLDPKDLVQFLSPAQGLIYAAPGAIDTALRLENARNRNATSAIPAGILKQTGGEPLSAQELADLAASFNAARATNQTAALNEYLNYQETLTSPDKMLLIESSQYQSLECARLANVPPYLVGVSTGAYSYQSAEQARADLYIFGVKIYAEAIAQTLSMNSVLPNGTYVEFDAENYLAENYVADQENEPQENTQEQIATR